MLTSWLRRYYWLVALAIAMAVTVGSARAPVPDLNPARDILQVCTGPDQLDSCAERVRLGSPGR